MRPMTTSLPKLCLWRTFLRCGFLLLLLFTIIPSAEAAASSFNRRNAAYQAPKEDPYRVLGVARKAPLDDIKKAYHAMAKAHHPDKNPDADPATAAANFRRIQDAWEFLSDPGNKRTYDLLGGTTNKKNTRRNTQKAQSKTMFTRSYGSHQQQQHKSQQKKQQHTTSHQDFQQSRAQLVQQVKQAQETLVKFSTLQDLKKTSAKILDQEGRYRKHFLAVFVGGKRMEQYVDQDLKFPYPFYTQTNDDSSSSSSTMPWQDILTTAKIRYNTDTPLTRTFRVPQHSTNVQKPYIVLGKKGDRLEQFKVYKPPRTTSLPPHEALQEWVVEQLTAIVTVTNHHDHAPLHIYLDRASNIPMAKLQRQNNLRLIGTAIPPQHQTTLRVHVSDQLWILNAHTDQFFGGNNNNNNNMPSFQRDLLQRADIRTAVAMDHAWITELEQQVNVGASRTSTTTRTCYDRSLHCHDWARQTVKSKQSQQSQNDDPNNKNCHVHYEFGHTMCPYSCGVCLETSLPGVNSVYYGLFHVPLHTLPTPVLRGLLNGLRGVAEFAYMFVDDLVHLWKMRRNIMAAFLIVGLVLGLQLVVVGDALILPVSPAQQQHRQQQQNPPQSCLPVLAWDNVGLVLLLTVSMIGWGIWLTLASTQDVPEILRGFQRDLHHMIKYSTDGLWALFLTGFISLVVSKKLVVERIFSRSAVPQQYALLYRVYAALTLVVVSLGVLLGATFLLENDILINGKENHRMIRWMTIWKLRKNVAAAVFLLGILVACLILAMKGLLLRCKKLVLVSLANAGILLVGGVLALKDSYFLRDLEHVLDMRMSAAVPCTIVGMMLGMSLVHFLTTYQVQVKVKVD